MIGFFDSGVGALPFVAAARRALPSVDLSYLGDTARAPYGNRSTAEIYEFTRQALDYLFGQGCIIVILACNTASAVALRRLQQEYMPMAWPDRRVLGVVRPLAEGVADCATSRVGIIGTIATISSGAFETELAKLRPGLQVISQPCPALVPLIEAGAPADAIRAQLAVYVQPLHHRGIDTLLLGCTHYEHLREMCQQIMGRHCHVVDGPELVIAKLGDYLQRHPEFSGRISRQGKMVAAVTRRTEAVDGAVREWLGQGCEEVNIV